MQNYPRLQLLAGVPGRPRVCRKEASTPSKASVKNQNKSIRCLEVTDLPHLQIGGQYLRLRGLFDHCSFLLILTIEISHQTLLVHLKK